MKKNLLSLMLLCFTAMASYAQLSLTGEINARTEYRNGFKKLQSAGEDPALFTEQRSRIYANYKAEKYEVQITLQDVRMWGANGQIHKTDNGMTALAEGWGRYYISPKFSVKAGRQMISYDNQRFLGGLEWAMQGRRHDALLFMYEDDSAKLKIHGALAFNQNPATGAEPVRLIGTGYPPPTQGAYHAVANYKHMEFVYVTKGFKDGNFSLYILNEGRQYDASEDSVANRQTYGLMGSKKLGGLKLEGELFYQGGKTGSADLSAFMFSLGGTYNTDITPITLGYDYLSGDDGTTGKNEAFDPAFGTNHAFYGYMDYFYVGHPHANKGLQDIYLKTKFKVAKGALMGHVHYFMGASDILEGDGSTASAGLGTEIDLVYSKVLTPGVTWMIGYSQMFATDTMELIKGGDKSELNNWAFTQIIFKPKFL